MLDAFPAILVLLAIGALGTLVYWSVAIFKIVRTFATVPTLRRGLTLPPPGPDAPSVCIIIPAHNEENVIVQLVASLRAQDYPNLRIVLSLDRCTDATVSRAREHIGGDPRFEILELSACPEGWAGKVHAVHAGVTRSTYARDAAMLLFADADTVFHPGCVRAAVALFRERGLDMLSVLSTLTHDRWYEFCVQPAAGLELMRQYPITRANMSEDRRAFANGQFMLFSAEAYRAIGGHEAVKDELLEDLELARRMAYANRPSGVFVADGILTCRMYHSWSEFVRGWKRIYTESAKRKDARLVKAAWQVRTFGALFPVMALVLAILTLAGVPGDNASVRIGLGALSISGLLVFWSATGMACRMGRTPPLCALLHPFGAWRVASILSSAARDLRTGAPTVWGGKSYVRERRT
jgi:cellulose synthase/poly-beta-1,6-N-acetylglucosamine synthase-like glycosyltransferase